MKIFQRYGEIESFELLFHKSGVKEGEPRGYCFVEFKTREVSARGSSDTKEMRKYRESRVLYPVAHHWPKLNP